jgi:type II secretory pathway pseudopilin PulG
MKRRSTPAFSLVEVTLALGIAAFCLIAVFGLMPVGVQANRNATSQTAATNIIGAVISDLRATPKNSTTSSQFSIAFGTNPPPMYFDGTGQFAGSIAPASPTPFQPRYQLNITWTGSAGLRYVDLKVTWPAAASPANASGAAEMFAAFDRN